MMKKRFRNFIKKFFLINDTPHSIAAGAALGIFMGMTPGEGVLSTLILASLFKFNRLASLVGVLAVNLWSTVAILPLAAYVGAVIFRVDVASLTSTFKNTRNFGWEFFLSQTILLQIALPLAVGYVIVAGIFAMGFYFIIHHILSKRVIVK